jgi:hypothetical protein
MPYLDFAVCPEGKLWACVAGSLLVAVGNVYVYPCTLNKPQDQSGHWLAWWSCFECVVVFSDA